MNEYWNQLSCFILPDEKAGDEGEEDAGDQLEEAVEPHVHPVQHVVVRRQLQFNMQSLRRSSFLLYNIQNILNLNMSFKCIQFKILFLFFLFIQKKTLDNWDICTNSFLTLLTENNMFASNSFKFSIAKNKAASCV